jgi:hypothetical protein
LSKISLLDFEVVCASHRPDLVSGLRESLAPVEVRLVDGVGATSFSSLVNKAFETSMTDIVFFANDKARPRPEDISEMCRLLDQGFALVAFYRLGFFAMRRSVFSSIGGMDVRFEDGGFEDNDLYLRLKFHNLAIYVSERIAYVSTVQTSWVQKKSRVAFHDKYAFNLNAKLIKVDFREMVATNEGSDIRALHKPWSQSYLETIPLETRKAQFDQVAVLSDFFDTSAGESPTLWFLVRRTMSNLGNLLIPNLRNRRPYRP